MRFRSVSVSVLRGVDADLVDVADIGVAVIAETGVGRVPTDIGWIGCTGCGNVD